MNRSRLRGLALILYLAAVELPSEAGISHPEEAQEFSVAPSDKVLLEKVVTETGVETTPPKPAWTDYVALLVETLLRRLAEALDPLGRGITRLVSYAGYAAAALLAAATIAGVTLAARFLIETLRARRKPVTASVQVLLPPGESTPAASTLRGMIEQRLGAGDVAGAIESLWWWLATMLVGAGADASWTTRELILRAGRKDLMPACRTMDRMIYGSARPTIPEIRLFVSRLDKEIA
ncbi:MAG: hypothetical protein AB1714_19935 [Acidobacteriota bacterium]